MDGKVATINSNISNKFSVGITISSGWTATASGIVQLGFTIPSTNGYDNIFVNGVNLGGANTSGSFTVSARVEKGDLVTTNKTGENVTEAITFYQTK